MANAIFSLKEPKSLKDTLIYIFINTGYKKFKYSTGEKINPKYWDFKNQKVKISRSYPELNELHTRLSNQAISLEFAFRKLENDKLEITSESLKREFELHYYQDREVISKKPEIEEPTALTLYEFIERYIEDGKGLKTEGSLKVYRTTFRHLKEYGDFKKKSIDFADVDLEFYNSFIHYLMHNVKLATNTIGKHIKTLKAFLNDATDRGFNTNLEFRKKKFKGFREDSDKIYLSNKEVKQIFDLDLSQLPYLERTRDLFIIGCCTGLRFSDYTQIKKENIIDDNKLKIKTQKTNDTVIIPLHPMVKFILDKYNSELPKAITNQKSNEYLKVIGDKAEINEEIEFSITKGGERIKTTVPKFKLISTHTARRSFATNLYLADVPAITIMKITGHKSDRVFLQYIRVTQEQNANKLLDHPFFKS